MGRKRIKPLEPIALSVAALADALGVSVRAIRDAIASGDLVAHDGPNNSTRILREDAVLWVRSWPRTIIRRHLKLLRSGA